MTPHLTSSCCESNSNCMVPPLHGPANNCLKVLLPIEESIGNLSDKGWAINNNSTRFSHSTRFIVARSFRMSLEEKFKVRSARRVLTHTSTILLVEKMWGKSIISLTPIIQYLVRARSLSSWLSSWPPLPLLWLSEYPPPLRAGPPPLLLPPSPPTTEKHLEEPWVKVSLV